MKIETWKKVMAIFGIAVQTIGYFLNSTPLIILGLIASILGIIFIMLVK